MGKVITFPDPKLSSKELMKLKLASDQFDAIITDSIQNKSINPKEVVGLLAHRLGTLLRSVEYKKDLWEVCQKIILQQSDLK